MDKRYPFHSFILFNEKNPPFLSHHSQGELLSVLSRRAIIPSFSLNCFFVSVLLL